MTENVLLRRYLNNKYLHLLFTMLLILILFPFIERLAEAELPLASSAFLLSLIVTLWAINLPKKVFRINIAIAFAIFILELALKVMPPSEFKMDTALLT